MLDDILYEAFQLLIALFVCVALLLHVLIRGLFTRFPPVRRDNVGGHIVQEELKLVGLDVEEAHGHDSWRWDQLRCMLVDIVRCTLCSLKRDGVSS